MTKVGCILLMILISPMLLNAEIEGRVLCAKTEEPIRYALIKNRKC